MKRLTLVALVALAALALVTVAFACDSEKTADKASGCPHAAQAKAGCTHADGTAEAKEAGCNHAAKTDLASIRGGEDNVGAFERGQEVECFHGRERLNVIDSAQRWLGHDRRPAAQQMLQSHPEGVTHKRHHHMGLDTRFFLMKQRPNRKLALQRPE